MKLKKIHHIPFALPCYRASCKHKNSNGRCSKDSHNVDQRNICVDYERRGEDAKEE